MIVSGIKPRRIIIIDIIINRRRSMTISLPPPNKQEVIVKCVGSKIGFVINTISEFVFFKIR